MLTETDSVNKKTLIDKMKRQKQFVRWYAGYPFDNIPELDGDFLQPFIGEPEND